MKSIARWDMSSASMKDVASLAKVSSATVSRAINTPERVDADTRRRIQSAIKQLGYIPDAVARSLRTQRTMQVGMCIPRLHNAQFSETVEAVQAGLRIGGYSLRLAVTGYDEAQECADAEAMIRHGVDGMVLIGGQHDPALFAALRSRGLPYVLLWSVHEGHPSVGLDHRRTMLLLTSHIIGVGHRRLGVIMAGLEQNERVRQRLKGITDALAAYGFVLTEQYLRQCPVSSFDAGGTAAIELLGLTKPPTALLCSNDVVAAGAMLACQRRGIAVPNDISIAGFGDTDIARMLSPPLTSVQVPVEDMCRSAVQYLLDCMSGERKTIHLEIKTKLALGGTCVPPRRAAKRPRGAVV